ncbi:MAG TPA: GPP34 family phosphoprotein [Pseudonocardiaceae bacterium]|nr:GPP34 family phosphoprotein [Pseudonocardiaceae bacterium]
MNEANGAQQLLADDFLLLALDSDTGRFPARLPLDGAVAVALLLELANEERLELFGPEDRVFVADDAATAHPALDHALAAIQADQGTEPYLVVTLFAKGSFEDAMQRLIESGQLREEVRRRGLARRKTWWHTGHERISLLRTTLAAVVVDNQEPDLRMATLISMLADRSLLHRLVVADKREVESRAAQIAEDVSVANPVTYALLNKSPVVVSTVNGPDPFYPGMYG